MIYQLTKGEETFLDVCKASAAFLFGCAVIFLSPILILVYMVGKASHGHLS